VQSAGGSIEIGERSSISDFCSLYGQGGLRIGRDVMLASGVRIVPGGRHICIRCRVYFDAAEQDRVRRDLQVHRHNG